MKMKKQRMVRKLVVEDKGQIFVEQGLDGWICRLEAWKKDHRNPCPMPKGHMMFKKPADYGCEKI